MARKPRGQGRPPGAPGPQQHSQPPRPQGGGSWGPLRDSVRRDVEQASSALAFAAALHDRLESQRRLFADFPRVMEQMRSGALERVATALARLFEGKEQFDLTRFLRDLPLALAQLAAAEAARKGAPREASSPDMSQVAAAERGSAQDRPGVVPAATVAPVERDTPTPQAPGTPAADEPAGLHPAPVGEVPSEPPDAPAASARPSATSAPIPPASAIPGMEGATPASASSVDAAASAAPAAAAVAPGSNGAGNGSGTPEPPSPRLELRSRLLAAAPQLGRAVVTYRRTVATVRRAASPRRAPGPWRSDREVLEEARLAVDFARQLFDAYAEAWADQPTQPGSAEAMSAETDRFLAWTQLARYTEVASPRSQPPPAEKKADETSEKQPVTQGTAGAGASPAGAEPAPGA